MVGRSRSLDRSTRVGKSTGLTGRSTLIGAASGSTETRRRLRPPSRCPSRQASTVAPDASERPRGRPTAAGVSGSGTSGDGPSRARRNCSSSASCLRRSASRQRSPTRSATANATESARTSKSSGESESENARMRGHPKTPAENLKVRTSGRPGGTVGYTSGGHERRGRRGSFQAPGSSNCRLLSQGSRQIRVASCVVPPSRVQPGARSSPSLGDSRDPSPSHRTNRRRRLLQEKVWA